MLLSIYKLDDNSKVPLCSFGCGEHIIGRGPSLQCNDKRISRKHLQIEVADRTASITAKHEINPCFYREALSKHISILKYNVPVELNDGDKFGFFPDQYWFQVGLSPVSPTNNNREGNVSSNSCNGTKENGDITVEYQDILNTTEESKKPIENQRKEESRTKNRGNCSGALNTEVNTAVVADDLSNAEPRENLNNNTAEVQANSTNRPELINTEIREDSNVDISENGNLNAAEKPNANHLNATSSAQDDNIVTRINGCDINSGNCNVSIETEIDHNYTLSRVKEEVTSQDQIEESAPANLPIKIEPGTEQEGTNEDRVTQPSTPANTPIKTEPSASANVPIKTEPDVKQEATSGDEDAAACCSTTNGTGNGDPPKKTYKDRCWYGSRCYRRNGAHKQMYRHPGDVDYDTDPEDDRPECQYGGACYRRNGNHRRDFKHSRFTLPPSQIGLAGVPVTPPAPPAVPQVPQARMRKTPKNKRKRKNANTGHSSDSDNDDDPASVNPNNVVNTKRQRKLKKKADTPSDDYDYSDPFLDDGSSDDEYLMDSDESDTD